MTAFEAGRRYGTKQAMAFLIELSDEPGLAQEIGKYILPTRQWRRSFREGYELRYGEDLLKKGFAK